MTEATTAAAPAARKIFCNAQIKVLSIKNEGVTKSEAARPFRSARAMISGLKAGNGERTVIAFGDNISMLEEGRDEVMNVVFDGTGGCVILGAERVKQAA